MEHWILRWRSPAGSEAVGVLELKAGTGLEEATALAFDNLQAEGSVLLSITCAETGEGGRLGFGCSNASEEE